MVGYYTIMLKQIQYREFMDRLVLVAINMQGDEVIVSFKDVERNCEEVDMLLYRCDETFDKMFMKKLGKKAKGNRARDHGGL